MVRHRLVPHVWDPSPWQGSGEKTWEGRVMTEIADDLTVYLLLLRLYINPLSHETTPDLLRRGGYETIKPRGQTFFCTMLAGEGIW